MEQPSPQPQARVDAIVAHSRKAQATTSAVIVAGVQLAPCPHCSKVPKEYEGEVLKDGSVSLKCGACGEDPDAITNDALHESFCVELMSWRIAGGKEREARAVYDAGLKSSWVIMIA